MLARKRWQLDRGKVLRVLLVVATWSAVIAYIWWLVPYEPRTSFRVPKDSHVIRLTADFKTAVTKKKTEQGRPLPSYRQFLCSWDVETGEFRADFLNNDRELQIHRLIQFSSDGRFMALIFSDREPYKGEIRLKEVATGRLLARKTWATGAWRLAPIDNPNFCSLIPGPVVIWDFPVGKETALLAPIECEAFSDVAVSPDGSLLCTVRGTGALSLWEIATGRKQLVTQVPFRSVRAQLGYPDSQCVWFLPDGKTFAYQSLDDQSILLWDIDKRERRAVLEGAKPPLIFSRDGSYLASRTGQGSIKVWDSASGQERNELPSIWGDPIYLSCDGSRLLIYQSNEKDGQFTLWNVSEKPASRTGPRFVSPPKFTADGRYLARDYVPNHKDRMELLDTSDCRCCWSTSVASSYPLRAHMAFTPDGNWLVLSNEVSVKEHPMEKVLYGKKPRAPLGWLPTVEVWDVAEGKKQASLIDCRFHSLSADGKLLATMTTDEDDKNQEILQIWDLPLRKPLWKILAWSLGLGLYVLCLRWLCGRIANPVTRSAPQTPRRG